MHIKEIDFSYPEELVAKTPSPDFRTLYSDASRQISEINKDQLLALFQAGDTLVINDTQVLKRRVFTPNGVGVLFIQSLSSDQMTWSVLFPAREVKIGDTIALPGSVHFKLLEKGLPQKVQCSGPLGDDYFEKYGEFALPPYIQKARQDFHNQTEDQNWYQSDWAATAGSSAAPTASLHFTKKDWAHLQARGVQVEALTLHVGIGTFLPIKTEKVEEHKMHKEWARIPSRVIASIQKTKSSGGTVWALGTTVARTLESYAENRLAQQPDGSWVGETDLFILPGYQYKIVDALMTNFHQPQSTLIALVAAFTSLDHVLKSYQWAMDRKFRLFSYGDLSVWRKSQ